MQKECKHLNGCFLFYLKRDKEGVIMPDKELENMTIWQNHEQRITTLEVTMTGLSNKMDNVEKTVKDGNEEQKKKLDMIDTRLVEEFFGKKRTNLENGWQLLGKVLGAGGILYLLFDLFISKFI